jgi:hypothetical protein
VAAGKTGNPVPGAEIGQPSYWGTYEYIQIAGPLGWRLILRLTTLLFIKITVAKSKKAKPGCKLLETSKEGYGSETEFCQ